jgi:hypothetical protein
LQKKSKNAKNLRKRRGVEVGHPEKNKKTARQQGIGGGNMKRKKVQPVCWKEAKVF